MSAIRPAAVAGSFYPADPAELKSQLDGFLARVRPEDGRVPKAIIAPHAGYVYSGPVAASAYALLAPARGRITRVVLIGPSHRVAFRGLALTSAEGYATPLGVVPVDPSAVEQLRAVPMVGMLDAAHGPEHSLEVHLPFLQDVLGQFTLVPVVAGEASAEEVAALLDALWGGDETLIVVSTDLSHYLDYAACQTTDARTSEAIQSLDWHRLERDGACGRVPVGGLLEAARRRGMEIRTLDVRNSGDTAGPKDRVVGYGSWALYEPGLVRLARQAIVHGVNTGSPHAPYRGGRLDQPGACFVTLKVDGALRGCIGSPIAHRALGEDLADNAFKAAFRDPRFPPLTPQELERLSLSVSLLTPPEPMRFTDQADLLNQLRPGVDGLIIEDGGHRALFLPAVWEQLPDKAAFLAHLKHKAGLAVDHWSPDFKASRFQAEEVKE